MPGVLFQQLMDNEVTFTGIKNTLFQSHKLSPAERDSFSDNLKLSLGSENKFTDALIDIASNPWVWFAFLTSPGVPTAVGKGARTIFQGSKYGAYVREKAPLLLSLGLWNANAHFHGSPIGKVLNYVAGERSGFLSGIKSVVDPLEKQVVERLRAQGIPVTSLNPLEAPLKYRPLMEEIDMTIYGALNNLGREGKSFVAGQKGTYTVERYASEGLPGGIPGVIDEADMIREADGTMFRRVSSENVELTMGEFNSLKNEGEELVRSGAAERVYVTEKVRPGAAPVTADEKVVPQLMNPAVLNSKIDEYGLQPLIDGYGRVFDDSFMKLYGMDDLVTRYGDDAVAVMNAYRNGEIATKDLIDLSKVKRISRSSANDALTERFQDPLSGEGVTMTAGKRMLAEFFDIKPDQAAGWTKEQFEKNITEVFDIHLKNKRYFPFGLRENIDQFGNSVYKGTPAEAKAQRQAVAAGMNLPRTKHPAEHVYHPKDIERMRAFAIGSEDAMRNLDQLGARTQRYMDQLPSDRALSVRRTNASRAIHIYGQRAAETYAFHVAGTSSRMLPNGTRELVYDKQYWDGISDLQTSGRADLQLTESGRIRAKQGVYDIDEFGPATIEDTFMDIPQAKHAPGGFSFADVINQGYKGMDGQSQQFSRDLLKETLIPRLMGRRTLQEMNASSLSSLVKHTARTFSEGPIGRAIAKSHPKGKELMDEMAERGQPYSPFTSPRLASGKIAKLLYVTHLGTNMASVMLNMTQPWMHTATWAGVPAVLRGYQKAFGELFSYMEDRARMGKVLLTDEEKIGLIQKHFKHAKDVDLGIGPDVFALADEATNWAARGYPTKANAIFFEFPMKLFEKAEWLNRLVTAHAVDDIFKKSGRYTDDVTSVDFRARMDAAETLVQETQFGGSVMNTPTVFLGKGFLGQMGDSPIVRQFLTFPLRTLTAFTPGVGHVGKMIGGGRRVIAGKEIDMGPFTNLFDFSRGMGIAAAIYYTGKNFLGVDVSRGLIANASTDMFGGSEFLEGGAYDWFPAPPAVDIPIQGLRSLLAGDYDVLRRTLPRLVPSGVGLSRALGVTAPGLIGQDNWLGSLVQKFTQKTYADWDNPTPDGLVPFFKGDGTFVDFRKPVDLILQGLGVDLGRSQIKGELDGYLVNQREEILSYRNRFLNAMFANNVSSAMKIKSEFERRFKIPLTVTKENLRSRMRNRNISRTERIMDRLPPEARSQYMPMVAARGKDTGIDPSAFNPETPTSTTRSKEFDRPMTYDLDPETLKILKRMVEDSKRQRPIKQRSFTEGYSAFDWRQ